MAEYFKASERGLDKGRFEKLNPLLLDMLDEVREYYGRPMIITSSYRGPDHPIEAAKPNGPGVHSLGVAVDVATATPADVIELVAAATAIGFRRIGVDRIRKFVHLDIANLTHNKPISLWTYPKR